MYTLYTDKQELFECSISLEGASVKNSQARLIVESDNLNLLFKGTIDSSGKCTVPIKKLKNLLEESTKGKIRLEVIADDTYFTPWESDFEVETAKKLTVEVKSQSNKTTIAEVKTGVTVQNIKVGDHVENLSKMSLNYSDYGYTYLDESEDKQGILSNKYDPLGKRFIWKNKYMDFYRANEIANQLNNLHKEYDKELFE
jgi:TusA-related sulfurtransferase